MLPSATPNHDATRFLQETCPGRSHKEIQQILNDSKGNVQMALDSLLNIEYLSVPPPPDPAVPSRANQSPLPTRKKKQTFSLTSNKFQDSRPATPKPQTNGRDERNEWVRLDSLSVQLADLMGIGAADFASMVHKRHFSFALALDTFLSAFEQERPFDMLLFQPPLEDSTPETRQQLLENLSAIITDHPFNQPSTWKRFLSSSNGNFENAIELARLYADFTSQEGTPNLVDLAKNLPAPAPAPKDKGKQTQEEWTSVTRYAIIAQPKTASSNQCRRMALEYRARAMDARRDASRHAAGARGGSLQSQGQRAAAMYWSERSLFFMKRAKEWEGWAAEHLISERQQVTGRNTLDLHNLNTSEAIKAVSESLNVWYNSKETTPLTIICGPGTHSRNLKPVLYPAVEAYLGREGWRYRTDKANGMFQVTGLLK